jgi:peroxiredoxin
MIRHGQLRCLAGIIALLAACGNAPDSGKPTGHDFRLPTLSHDRFYLNQHRGRAVMLVFWTTDCPQCLKELAVLGELRREIPTKRLTLAAVCTDPHNLGDLQRIVSRLDISVPVLLDRGAAVKSRFGLRGVPATVLIDPDGRTRSVHYGYSPALFKHMRTQLAMLLDAEAPS